jgi:hypothetical protein
LNDYEAYRRGDHFYVKIPAADVARAEALRGRGFGDVKAQRSGDSTVVSFKLQPGATAHVEQRSNRLEVVFTVPGGNSAALASAARDLPRPPKMSGSNKNASTSKNANANKRAGTAPASTAGRNSSDRSNSTLARNAGNANSSSAKAKPTPSTTLNSNSAPRPTATPAASPQPSPRPSATTPSSAPLAGTKSSPTPAASPAAQTTPSPVNNQTRQDWWGRMKERINYWILMAQLNPGAVATGVIVLVLLAGLFLLQRKRARSPRRVRSSVTKTPRAKPTVDASSSVSPQPEADASSLAAPAAGLAAAGMATPPAEDVPKDKPATREPAPPLPSTKDPRPERINKINEEAKKLTNGAGYDEGVIGSDDPETRKIVGAELLAALVGRNVARRENARAAFMKHGYFDDATRDLRIADSENERSAAARRLSFVNDREATPHLIGALGDASPDVRRSAVEALMDLRDPAAIPALNSLMQTENDRKVPRPLIKQAIEACATSGVEPAPEVNAPADTHANVPEPASHPVETEREVIEI